ncbi:MAG TPA: BlaI/MecI/CopY family transcriptional regulator [Bryobacteraceae bacterium]|jgi:predicted transcriptional regulator
MRKAGPPPEIPPPLELECLKALWTLGEGNVKDVRDVLTASRKLAYTTVMTVLDRLEKRGKVARRKQGRKFVYTPAVSRDTLRRLAVDALIEDFFDGSETQLAQYVRSAEAPVDDGVPEETPVRSTLDAALL